jgi:hypothetical protein
MVEQPHLDLNCVIDVLRKEHTSSWDIWDNLKRPDISPWEFLSFARQDLEEDSERGRINALTNAKRAIECRADELLALLNFRYFSAKYRWGLPYKMQVLKTFGISAPDVLTKYIGSKRNLLEHQYVRPKETEQIRYIADIAELFISATDRYIENGYISRAGITYIKEKGERQKKSARVDTSIDYEDEYEFTFDLENDVITITYRQSKVTKEYNRITAEIKSRSEKLVTETTTMAIGDCKQEDVRELTKLLRQKAD